MKTLFTISLTKKKKKYEGRMFNQMKPIFATYFLHILWRQVSSFYTLISLLNRCKDLQFFIFWGPWSISWVLEIWQTECHSVLLFLCFPPELAGLRTEIRVWLLKVKYLLYYFRWRVIFYLKHFCYKNLQVSLVYSDSIVWV